ncbi:unnamed protein product [Lactuca virosa]|uniref:Uncharacterized protein n=1 Tax=Lactuca virosa TaxID=75947 RepID=A0AAU9PS55_9ASTR|nr:unnamed protein product [Lactuca virosa]
MGSLGTHFTSFLFLFPLGVRRLVSSFSIYLNNPSLYRSKTWPPDLQVLLLAAICSRFPFLDFLLSSGLVLKGTWVLQVGLSLYTDAFAFKGCGKVVIAPSQGQGNTDVKCDLEEDKLRGMALMNLLFVVHSIMVLIMCFVLLGLLSRNKVRPGDPPIMAQLDSDRMLMHPLPALEME